MPHHSKYDNVHQYIPDEDRYRKNIIGDATSEAQGVVDADYPYAVYRSQHEATQVAETIYQQWLAYIQKEITSNSIYNDKERQRFNSLLNEMKRLYVSAFVGKYLEEVAEKDKKAGKQPTPTPATSTTVQGVSIALLKVDRNGNEFVYTIRIDDPSLQYPIIRELEFDTSNLQTWKGAYGVAYGEARRG